ncbi:MAG: biotin--[acetyl-CoA-carboxylase] ligase [Acidobacteria bacterium RIFCSPLOWO2_12_FULL_65_11]|nr:MAG: biotin--[acetyl-CoA-carboxylase] ligase [Acidobacteria bacterium RIFCSPLOWO2_02_FULL_64_15]OFW29164.1 MAG: biotin--[acetyl-CoA-carboxylase] ligase [Acidobacteria bacterium RIFCSPLOWO2_12_FULL_65_11]
MLDRARPRLGRLGSRVLYFPTVGSTNDVALALASHLDCEGAVVLADEQTSGRGRRGRVWFSPPASGLYVSVVLTPARARTEVARATRLLTMAAGLALAEAVEASTGLIADLKWPNDLHVGGRKLAGILAEATTAGEAGAPRSVIVGYGVNVGPMAYPPELGNRATALEVELGRPVDRALVLIETLAALARRYDDLLAGRFDAILDAWRRRAPDSVGARVTWADLSGLRSGFTDGIDDDGALLVRVGERVERIDAGEVTWL